MKVAVTFLKAWRHYNPGEIAGFSKTQADSLVAGNVAELAPVPAAEKGKGGTKKAAPNASGTETGGDGGVKAGGDAGGGDGGANTGGDTGNGGAGDGDATKKDD